MVADYMFVGAKKMHFKTQSLSIFITLSQLSIFAPLSYTLTLCPSLLDFPPADVLLRSPNAPFPTSLTFLALPTPHRPLPSPLLPDAIHVLYSPLLSHCNSEHSLAVLPHCSPAAPSY